MYSCSDMNQNTHDNEGIQYIFGYLDKKRGWRFPQHRFQLVLEPSGTIVGQYLTSNWYSQMYDRNTIQRYMIIGIRGGFSYSQITAFITTQLVNTNKSFPDIICPQGCSVVFYDYFEVSAAKTTELMDKCELNETKVVNLSGHRVFSDCSLLSLRIRLYNGGLYVTLPCFVRTPSNV